MSTTSLEVKHSSFPCRPKRGFALVSAIFILVVLAALAGFVVSVSTGQSLGFAQDLQGARAYQAARAGIDWGIARWLGNTPSLAADCPGSAVTISALDGFTVSVRGTLTSSAGINFCTLEATAQPDGMSAANIGTLGFVERQLRAVVEGN